MKKSILLFVILGILVFIACSNSTANKPITTKNQSNTSVKKPKKIPSEDFKKYWYAGEAEITSYELEQARYGEIRKGTSVLIYVTEDFLPKEQVKADGQNSKNIPVLKLNATKRFNTGIYPYSIMQSTFYPVADNRHAIKVSNSMQEWCGHVYAQLNNRKEFEILSHSYFQNEADQQFKLEKNTLENEIWTKIRINPKDLPQGEIQVIPSFEFCRLKHKEIKAYQARASLQKGDTTNIYTLEYPELERSISISFTNTFPYEIEGWTETFISGFGPNAKQLTTKATRMNKIKSAYWGKNSNSDEVLRTKLKLK
ncbi:septum formation inhibitor Maf [Aquimarina aquimarini]|uniref:septum formation inhibitor Maf n=1 Tax=Aquimarina aquimarini TaxID=1191734 RepID=UPI000D55BA78|nr:septum formation inhibitor Maf [Aquimarina aquimarini]